MIFSVEHSLTRLTYTVSLFYPFDTPSLCFGDWDEDWWPSGLGLGGQTIGQRVQGGRGAQQRQGTRVIRPRMDWIDQESKNVVTFELPGLAKSDVDISLHNDILTISGTIPHVKDIKEDATHLVTERRYGQFQRAITVPHGLKEDEIKAHMGHGLLKLEFPKEGKASETKRITVQ